MQSYPAHQSNSMTYVQEILKVAGIYYVPEQSRFYLVIVF